MGLRYGLLRPRHVTTSLLLLLLLGAGGGAVLGLVAADDSKTPPFVLPAPHHGDRGVYQLTSAPLDEDARRRGFDEARALRIAFAVGDTLVHYDEAGQAHHAVEVALNRSDERGTANVFVRLDVQTLRPVGSVTERVEQRQDGARPGLLPGTGSNVSSEVTWRTMGFRSDHDLPCGLFNPYQRHPAPEAGDVREDTWTCMWGPGPRDPNAHWRTVVGTSAPDEGDLRQLLVEHERTHPLDRPDGHAEWRVWYREDIPYPMRVEDVRGGAFGAPGDVLELVGFERGGTPLPGADQDLPPLPPLPPLEYVARTPWLVDDTGLDHPWPLGAAFTRARDDPSQPGLRDFLAQHPDAYLAHAAHAAFRMDGRFTNRWSFTVTDGDDTHSVAIARDENTPDFPLLAQPSTTYRYEDPWLAPIEDVDLPPAALLPDAFPTAASLLAQWQAVLGGRGNPEAVPSWEFLVSCDEGCTRPHVRLGAGQTFYYRDAEPLYPLLDNRDDVWDIAMLTWEDGALVAGTESEQVHRTRSSPEPMPVPAPAGGAQVAGTTFTPVWAWPTPQQAAGIGAAAFLAALAYWLWPALKAGPTLLFTRVQRHRLLDNPRRQAMLDAIEVQPGIHFQALVRTLGQPNGTVEHHLHKLVEGGLVTAVRGPRYTCYFPTGQVDRRVMAAAPLLKSEGARRVLETVRAHGGASPADIARRVAMSPQTVHYHLHRLEEAGLVSSRRDGRLLRMEAAEA